MKLYLVRHGEAVAAEVDAQRPLSARGQKEITRLADFLSPFGVLATQVYHSTQLRARQTAGLLAASLAPGQEMAVLSDLESGGSAERLYDQILGWSDDTLLVSHLPLVEELLAQLLGARQAVPLVAWHPGTMVCLERVSVDRWLINWILTPSVIPDGK